MGLWHQRLTCGGPATRSPSQHFEHSHKLLSPNCPAPRSMVHSPRSLRQLVQIAGGKDESVMQPCWLESGDLVFISDRGNG